MLKKLPRIVLAIRNKQAEIIFTARLKRLYHRAASSILNDYFTGKAALPKSVEISLILCDNQFIRELNRKHRDKDADTDVLSFPLFANGEEMPEATELLLGDIVISLQKAQSQAEELGHSMDREAVFLFIHGLLHLIGYDHETYTDEQKMLNLQDQLLTQLDLPR